MYERLTTEWDVTASDSWFVYLFRVSDCTAFKIGFTCNPLQRLYSFSHRYFEGFDLDASSLLQLGSCADAREIEAALKTELAAFRIDPPFWVAQAAGGYTEWFGAVHLDATEDRLRSFLGTYERTRLGNASEVIRDHLSQYSASFEHWAFSQAQRIHDPRSFAMSPTAARDAARNLRDWLDAYRHFDIRVFANDALALQFVLESTRVT